VPVAQYCVFIFELLLVVLGHVNGPTYEQRDFMALFHSASIEGSK
jgi:hypothetical protein